MLRTGSWHSVGVWRHGGRASLARQADSRDRAVSRGRHRRHTRPARGGQARRRSVRASSSRTARALAAWSVRRSSRGALPTAIRSVCRASRRMWSRRCFSKAPFDPVKDFTHVALFGGPPTVLALHPSLPANDLKAFIALAKSRPAQLTYGSPRQRNAGTSHRGASQTYRRHRHRVMFRTRVRVSRSSM